MKPLQDRKWEVRECATLGTLFADIYCDGELFAREISRKLAEKFCAEPWMFGGVHADVPKLRTWILENEYIRFAKDGLMEQGLM